jgi:pSer/pThr/pTyr-binding forkhead associated (FHA) protein
MKDGREVHLAPKAFDLLVLLVSEAPQLVRKDELHRRLWPGTFVTEAALVVLVKQVRRALDDHDPTSPFIRTAHGVGYAFAGKVQRNITTTSGVSHWILVDARRIPLGDGANIIGRDPASAVHLGAAGISRRHAQIIVNNNDAVLEDLGSKNGTAVNDASVVGRVALHDGDRVKVGAIVIIYHASASGMSTITDLQTPLGGAF